MTTRELQDELKGIRKNINAQMRLTEDVRQALVDMKKEQMETLEKARTILGWIREEAESADDINVMLYLDELEHILFGEN